MKRCWMLYLLFVSAVWAVEPARRLVALNGGLGAGIPAVIECFDGETEIRAVFLADAAVPGMPVVDVYLDAEPLGVALHKAIPFKLQPAATHPSLLEGAFLISLPATRGPTRFRVLIREATGADGTGRIIASAKLAVTPQDTLKQALQACTNRSERPVVTIVVFGKLTGLRELLAAWSIPFRDAGANPPVTLDAGTVAIGSLEALKHLPVSVPESAMLVLTRDAGMDVDAMERSGNRSIQFLLRAPDPDDWRTSPKLQRHLLQLLQFNLQQP